MDKLKKFEDIIILSIEDDGFNQELASAVFEDYPNLKIVQAFNGQEGIDMLGTTKVDLILLDLMMPKMNGFETLKHLKNHSTYRDIPVIVVTSKEDEQRETYKLGANDFLSKPYSPEELKLRVLNHLNIQRFATLYHNIKGEMNGSNIHSENYRLSLKEAVDIAINSQKKLLSNLFNIIHPTEQKDENISQRLGEYAQQLAKLYGLNSVSIDNIYYCMFIYDIGLLMVQPDYRTKPNSKEFKKYPLLGLHLIEDLDETSLIKMAKDVILYHQENWDGSGYTKQLKSDDIPISAQIASIVNYFDELTTSRIYSANITSSTEALEIMQKESGIKFSPTLLKLFSENFEEFKKIKNKFS